MPTKFEISTALAKFLLDPRRDIELFGMYGANNLGDEAMCAAGFASLPRGRAVPVTGSGNPLLRRWIRARWRRDLVIGGGTLVHGGRGDAAKTNPWLDYAELRAGQGSRLSFMGTGVSFEERQMTPPWANPLRWGALMREARYVGLRGPLSQAMVARLGIEAEIFGDAVFQLHDPAVAARWGSAAAAAGRPVGINVGDLLRADQPAYEARFARTVARIAKDHPLRFFVVNPVDAGATQRVIVAAGLPAGRYTITANYTDTYGFMREVAGCYAFVGIRLHGAGLAMVAGVPSLLIEYKEKCRDFMLPIGMDRALLPVTLDEDFVSTTIDDLLAKPERYRADPAIAAMASTQRAKTRELFGQAQACPVPAGSPAAIGHYAAPSVSLDGEGAGARTT